MRNETLEVTNSDVQDSATVMGEDTPRVLIVADSDNDSHGSAPDTGQVSRCFEYFG